MFFAREKYRIDILSALILLILTLTASVSVYVVMQQQAEALLSKGIVSLLQSNQRLFQSGIEQSLAGTVAMTKRPFVIQNLQLLSSKLGHATAAVDLQRISQSALVVGFSGISVYDFRGRVVARAGHFSQKHELRVPLKSNNRAFLLWDEQFILQASSDIFDPQGRRIGVLNTEAKLSTNTEAFNDIAAIGKTGEFAVCAPLANDNKHADCFVRRISGSEFKRFPLRNLEKPSPMSYALSGASGLLFTQDYRLEQVVAAYAPVGTFDLGILLKIDRAELYQPVSEQLKIIVPLLVALVLAGILLLKFLVRPLVRKLVDSERLTRDANHYLLDTQEKLNSIYEGSHDAIVLLDENGFFDCNVRTLEMFDLKDKTEFIGHHPSEFSPPVQADGRSSKVVAAEYIGMVYAQGKGQFEWMLRHKNGDPFPAEILASAFNYGGNRVLQATIRDISARKQSEKAIRQLNTDLSQFKNLFDQTLDSVFMFDPNTLRFTYVNEGAKRQVGYSGIELMQMTLADIVSEFSLAQFQEVVQPLIEGVQPSLTFRSAHRHKDGRDIPVEIFLQLIRLEGQAPCYVAMASDISERQAAQKKIEFLAYHDVLTSLPNRLLAKDHLEQAIFVAERENSKVALLFIDLDNFKTINDSLGHVIGDGLLKGVAIRLRECLRDIDTLSRQGGDEFLIVLNSMRDTDSITLVAEKILERIAELFVIDHHELSISLSVGIAVYPDDSKDFDTLLKQSDTAMYQAKESGRNTYRFHTGQMNIDAIEHLRMRNGLRHALEHGEFVLHYQPQINLATGAVFGAEALLRWNHPEFGMVPPGRFISIAEDSGLIVLIGDWVLKEACRQAVAWRKAGLPEMMMAVNLSAVQFKRGDVEKSVTHALTESGLKPALLELELTESILIKDTDKVLATVSRLKSLGVKLSIDDFGTGYSSLSYLKRFNVDKLKIDQSFVRDMADNPNDAAIVSAIIQMAKSLNLSTIAEGVEDERQLALLRLQHCNDVQGYYFARPMPADEFASFMFNLLPQPTK